MGFETDVGPDLITGAVPVKSADLVRDFDAVSNSRIGVALDVTGAQTSPPLAAQAMTHPKMVESRSFPVMSFPSTAICHDGDSAQVDGAQVDGALTICGGTPPSSSTSRCRAGRPVPSPAST